LLDNFINLFLCGNLEVLFS